MGFGADSATNMASKTGFRSNSNKSGTTPAHDWLNYAHHIDTFSKRLRGVIIENKDALEIMRQHDGPETVHYVDPPYTHDTRRAGRYKHEMFDECHDDLLIGLKDLKGTVLLSGYDNEKYNALGWRKETKEARADKAGLRLECLWINR